MNFKKDPVVLEIEKMNYIPDDVKEKSYEIIHKIEKIPKRRKKRRQIIFYIIYNCYLNLGYPVHSQSLGKKLGLSRGDISQTIGLFKELDLDFDLNVKTQEADNYLKIFCNKCNFNEEFKDEMICFYENIIRKEPDLKEETPLILASGIFKYFLMMKGIEYEKNNDFVKITKVSKATTEIYYKKISKIDNRT